MFLLYQHRYDEARHKIQTSLEIPYSLHLYIPQTSLLSMACLAFMSLIHPLRWPYVFIPVLPQNLIDFLDCPTPYIVGVHTSMYNTISEVCVYVCVCMWCVDLWDCLYLLFFHSTNMSINQSQRNDLPEYVAFFLDEGRWYFSKPVLSLPVEPEKKLRLTLQAILQPQLTCMDECLASDSAVRDVTVYSTDATNKIQVNTNLCFPFLQPSDAVFASQMKS